MMIAVVIELNVPKYTVTEMRMYVYLKMLVLSDHHLFSAADLFKVIERKPIKRGNDNGAY